MNELLKKPYKITLWEDKNIYIVNGEKKTSLNSGDIVQNQYLEEVCIATIGSDISESPIRAFNPILTEELNGSKTFSFQIFYRYWDDKDEDFKLNPFTNLLVNERKVKLKYNNEWYDFVIKQCEENSESNTFTYTCKDLFINELGKTGYEVELDTELQNNMGTITELATTILEGSDWKVDIENCDHLVQRNKEMLYSYVLQSQIIGENMLDSNDTISINSGKTIFIFYSCKANEEDEVQFLYVPGEVSTIDEYKEIYKIDEDGFIINSKNWKLHPNYNINYNNVTQISSYFGNKLVSKQKAKYIPEIDEVCYLYNNDNSLYYCYTESEYASVAEIQDMLSNSTNFVTTNGWSVGEGNCIITLGNYLSSNIYYNTLHIQKASSSSGSYYIQNSGFFDNRAILSPNGWIAGEPYILAVKGSSNGFSSGKVYAKNTTNQDEIIFLNFTDSRVPAAGSLLEGYRVFEATVSQSMDYQTFLNNYSNLVFQLDITFPNNQNNIDLIDIKVFKKRLDSEGKLIVPDLQDTTNSIIKTRYNFFPASTNFNNIYGKEDLEVTESILLGEGEPTTTLGNYTPEMIDGYGKVTSISGSKSNRFNLIQSLCEAFECWAKFTIDHDENGKTIYEYVTFPEDEFVAGGRYYTRKNGATSNYSDDNNFIISNANSWSGSLYKKVYHKYITFKEYIGDNNQAGFRYGINLKSIQRNIISDQIASRVIVQPNTNEFAPNGSCTIQQALLNPTGENALYNFQYYINHGLLDENSLNDDLYGTNGGLNFFGKLKQWNNEVQPKIEEYAILANTLTNLNSKQIVYDTLLLEAKKSKQDKINEIRNAGYNEGLNPEKNDINDYIKNLIRQSHSFETTIKSYEEISTRNNNLLNSYKIKENNLRQDLLENERKKKKLVSDFHNKYFNFIQEGIWTSNDYYDSDLYYEAANQVLYTSSFPQISYTINVLEISQVEGYENYSFKIADRTYIEDTEFFGYDKKKRPYKEEVVISQVKYNLDDPSQNTITIQNYKTQFQDLFQRIAATSQTLQYNEGFYNRAANAINNDGTINSTLLQNSLKANQLIIQNAKNQSVVWDETGITITKFTNANEIVKLTSGGIVLSKDGGLNWTTGISGSGINAEVITTGRLDTDRIRIFNSGMKQAFEWNSKGLNAYAQEDNAVNYSKFVRFDQYGLYGYAGGDVNWDPNVKTNGKIGINKVIQDAIFSLTWKGLKISLPQGQGWTAIKSPGEDDNPSERGWFVYTGGKYRKTEDTTPQFGTNYFENNEVLININDRLKIYGDGRLVTDSNAEVNTIEANQVLINGIPITEKNEVIDDDFKIQAGFLNLRGIEIKNRNNEITFKVTQDGNVYIGSEVVIGGDNIVEWDSIEGTPTYLRPNEIYSPVIRGGTIIGGTITGGVIEGAEFYGETFYIRPSSRYSNPSIELAGYNDNIEQNYLKIYPYSDFINFSSSRGYSFNFDAVVYARNFLSNSAASDRKLKTNINYNLSKYNTFIKKLKPCSFNYKKDLEQIEIGLIAQEVEEALISSGLSTKDFNVIIKNKDKNNEETYYLNYPAFIPLQQYQIQQLEKRIEQLENLISL